jgi:hypothetical protein
MRLAMNITALPMPGTSQPGGQPADVSLLTISVPPGYNGAPMEVMALRTTRIDFGHEDISSVTVTQQPAHGRAVVNPDHSISLVLSLSEYTGEMSMSVAVVSASGTQGMDLNFDVIPSVQQKGWSTGLGYYNLPVKEDGFLDVQPGASHRKVYVAPDGLTAAQIEATESLSAGTVTATWLRDNATGQTYGVSEETALSPGLGFGLWTAMHPVDGSTTSNWLLIKRGGTYGYDRVFRRAASGESPLHPLYVGAWGEGEPPILTTRQEIIASPAQNMVLEDVMLASGASIVGNPTTWRFQNIIFNRVRSTKREIVITRVEGITVRDSLIYDCWQDAPNNGTSWDGGDREMGMYADGSDGIFIDGVIFDHNGWAPDFVAGGGIEGGHPPHMYNHNLYMQGDCLDAGARNCLFMRGASVGSQFRPGATVIDSAFIDNNVALNANGGMGVPTQNYSAFWGALITQASGMSEGVNPVGATEWGFDIGGRLTTLRGCLVAHANDPNDAGDTQPGLNAIRAVHSNSIASDDTLVWRWQLGAGGTPNTQNAAGVDATTANATTIHNYALTLPNGGVPATPRQPWSEDTIQAYAEYLRGLDPKDYRTAVDDVLEYFRAGFGVSLPPERTEAATLYFVPDARGDGVRWDNPLNWQLADGSPARPPRNGDTVRLRGALVISPCDTWNGTIHLEGAALTIVGGRLSGTAAGPGVIKLIRAGQHDLNLSGGATVDDQR